MDQVLLSRADADEGRTQVNQLLSWGLGLRLGLITFLLSTTLTRSVFFSLHLFVAITR